MSVSRRLARLRLATSVVLVATHRSQLLVRRWRGRFLDSSIDRFCACIMASVHSRAELLPTADTASLVSMDCKRVPNR